MFCSIVSVPKGMPSMSKVKQANEAQGDGKALGCR